MLRNRKNKMASSLAGHKDETFVIVKLEFVNLDFHAYAIVLLF